MLHIKSDLTGAGQTSFSLSIEMYLENTETDTTIQSFSSQELGLATEKPIFWCNWRALIELGLTHRNLEIFIYLYVSSNIIIY